ncbi:MAG: UPF0147 family protein [Methanosarcinales archaeon]|nr:UPF0147 family protein [Methanosarcinales archaeon]
MTETPQEKIKQCIAMLNHIATDSSVPRNIRRSAEEIRTILSNDDEELNMKVASGISILNSVNNDPNMPLHTRTLVWNLSSQLESIPIDS